VRVTCRERSTSCARSKAMTRYGSAARIAATATHGTPATAAPIAEETSPDAYASELMRPRSALGPKVLYLMVERRLRAARMVAETHRRLAQPLLARIPDTNSSGLRPRLGLSHPRIDASHRSTI
jgi:hypothetical protein